MKLKCDVIKETKRSGKRSKIAKGRGTGSKLAKAATKCKGKKGKTFKTCVKATIKKM